MHPVRDSIDRPFPNRPFQCGLQIERRDVIGTLLRQRSRPLCVFASVTFVVGFVAYGSAQIDPKFTVPNLSVSQPASQPAPDGMEKRTKTGLPNAHGQVWQEYDIRAYSESLPNEDKPEEAIVDWILRETGTDAWFSEPAGMLNVSHNTIRVYHTPAIQRVVADIVNRFVHRDAGSYAYGFRLVTVQSPNWRSWAYHRLQPVPVQTPGVEAWLVAKEDAAIIFTELKKRHDFREYTSPNMLIQNSETRQLSRMHPVSYVKSVTSRSTGLATPLQTPTMGQVEQGFRLSISPLLSADERSVDAIIKAETNQVEQLISVPVNASTTKQRGISIQVPQTSSWHLHERFRWPVEKVLIIGCGVVTAPAPQRRLFAIPTASRVEALLFLEAKGKHAGTGHIAPNVAERGADRQYEGRY